MVALVVALHLSSVSNFRLTPLSDLTTQVQEFESAEGYGRPGSILLVEDNSFKEAWNDLVFIAYLTVTMQRSQISPQVVAASHK